jgi:hypothetical protein
VKQPAPKKPSWEKKFKKNNLNYVAVFESLVYAKRVDKKYTIDKIQFERRNKVMFAIHFDEHSDEPREGGFMPTRPSTGFPPDPIFSGCSSGSRAFV